MSEHEPNNAVRAPLTESEDKASPTAQAVQIHPLVAALDAFLHRCEDIKEAEQEFVPLAADQRGERITRFVADLRETADQLIYHKSAPTGQIRNLQGLVLGLNRSLKSRLPEVIESSLFLGLFSAFDAFTGQLMTALYRRKPELFATLSRQIPIAEILSYKSFHEVQSAVLRNEIEDFRRKSYVDQFKDLENTFGIKLRSFERWPQFVECAQRRNLMTHCDGEVSEQYLEVCKKEGYTFSPEPKLGEKLQLGAQYCLPKCDLLAEVAVKLTHTLWRKLLPHESEEADKELNAVVYDRLQVEQFTQAQEYGKFAYHQKHVHSDLNRRVSLVNYAIALKFGGKPDEAKALLKQVDWTACAPDFKLAEAVLDDRISDACDIMRRIGMKGDLISEASYHEWPLFRSFRTTSDFLATYEAIYGRPFVFELQKAADKAQMAAGAEGIV